MNVVSKSRTSFLKEFDQTAHYVYHTDTTGYEMEDCQSLRHKIQDLIGTEVISIDFPNKKYEVNDHFKLDMQARLSLFPSILSIILHHQRL